MKSKLIELPKENRQVHCYEEYYCRIQRSSLIVRSSRQNISKVVELSSAINELDLNDFYKLQTATVYTFL